LPPSGGFFLLWVVYNKRADRLASRQATSPSRFRKPFSVKLNGDSYD